MSRTITTIDATDGRIVTDLTWRDLTNPYLATSLQTAVAAQPAAVPDTRTDP